MATGSFTGVATLFDRPESGGAAACEVLMGALQDADGLPPDAANAQPDREVEDRADEAQLVPVRLSDVAGVVERRARADAVEGQAAHEVGQLREAQGGGHGGRAAGNGHRQEGGVHGTDVGGAGGKQVVGVVVQQHDNQEGWLPGQAEPAHQVHNLAGEPGDEALLVEVRRHGDESCKPGEGVPGLVVAQALLPGGDAGDQQDGEANQRRGHRVHANAGAADPQGHGDGEGSPGDLLIQRQWAQLVQLLPRLDRRIGGVLDFRREESIQNEGHADEAAQARHNGSQRPAAPGDVDPGGGSQVDSQRIGGHGGDEHGRRDGGGLEAGLHQVGAHLLLGAVLRAGAARDAQRLGQREEDAAGARGHGGDRGRQQRLRKDEGVGETQRGLAEQRHDGVRHTAAQARLDEGARKPEGDGDQPGNLAGEGAEGGSEGHRLGEHRGAETEHGHRTERQRGGDDSGDGGDEDGEQVPCLGRHSLWRGDKPEHHADGDARQQGLHLGAPLERLRRRIRGRGHCNRGRGGGLHAKATPLGRLAVWHHASEQRARGGGRPDGRLPRGGYPNRSGAGRGGRSHAGPPHAYRHGGRA
mmetsp:Transcript_36950/g.93304  ORF Transcript_36950/g.93304 Transcript_36950/m.93304 type:complete len:585 (+) Transcript_36950:55-1809(+)